MTCVLDCGHFLSSDMYRFSSTVLKSQGILQHCLSKWSLQSDNSEWLCILLCGLRSTPLIHDVMEAMSRLVLVARNKQSNTALTKKCNIILKPSICIFLCLNYN